MNIIRQIPRQLPKGVVEKKIVKEAQEKTRTFTVILII